MSVRNELDLDAILAEFHQEETAPAPARGAEAAPVRRRDRLEAERAAAEQAAAEQAPGEGTTVYAARPVVPPQSEPRPASRQPQPESRPAPRQERPSQKPQPQREHKTARRRRQGRIRVVIVLVLLAAALAGLVWWAVREERERVPEEPVPIRMELGQELGDYLEDASLRSRR